MLILDKNPEKLSRDPSDAESMAVSRTYSVLHNQPASPDIVLKRFLGIDAPSLESTNDRVGLSEEHDNHSMTTNEFLADMETDQSEIDSLYEMCGALIEEGFPKQSDREDDDADEIDCDMPSPQASCSDTTSPPASPTASTSAVKSAVAFHHVTGLPIPPFMLNNPTPPVPDRRDAGVDVSPKEYKHLDPTRPNPYVHYLCQWERSCVERIKGASPGRMQCHLRRVHQVYDSGDHFVRCEQPTSCKEDRMCGDQVPAKELGMHVCDVHWRSRVVQCPFCGVFQTHRNEVPQHWVESCSEFATASEEEQKAWRQFWKWPAKNWFRELS